MTLTAVFFGALPAGLNVPELLPDWSCKFFPDFQQGSDYLLYGGEASLAVICGGGEKSCFLAGACHSLGIPALAFGNNLGELPGLCLTRCPAEDPEALQSFCKSMKEHTSGGFQSIVGFFSLVRLSYVSGVPLRSACAR